MTKNEIASMNQEARLTAFFETYINFPFDAFWNEEHVLKRRYMQEAVKFLIQGGIFEGKSDMKKEALRAFSVILPEILFEGVAP